MNNLKKSAILTFSLTLFSNVYGQLAIGFGGIYGTDINQYGVNGRLYYFPNEKICFGPEIAYYPSISEIVSDVEIERQLTEYGFSGHYIIEVSHKLAVFPLLGISFATEKETEKEHNETIKHINRAIGVNIGGGVHASFGRFLPFAEYKYVTGKLRQHVMSLGVIYVLKKRSESKNSTKAHPSTNN